MQIQQYNCCSAVTMTKRNAELPLFTVPEKKMTQDAFIHYPTELLSQYKPNEAIEVEPEVVNRRDLAELQFQIAELQSKLIKPPGNRGKITLASVDAKLDVLIKIITEKM